MPSLSVVSTLADLNLSHNSIDDDGFTLICDGLQAACSLRHLNLSFNKFGGKSCICIGKALVENRSLYTMDLSGNDLHCDIFSALSTGLLENVTLIQLNLLRCNLSLQTAHTLRGAMALNSTCKVLMDFNPLPDAIRWDSRSVSQDVNSHEIASYHRSSHSKKDIEASLAFKQSDSQKTEELIEILKLSLPLSDDARY